MDTVLSVISPGVHPILKIVLVGRIAKFPEQSKLTSVVGCVNLSTKRHAVVVARRAAIAAINHGGTRIGHCNLRLRALVVPIMITNSASLGMSLAGLHMEYRWAFIRLRLWYCLSVQHYFLTWTDLICPGQNIVQSNTYLEMTCRRVITSLQYLRYTIFLRESGPALTLKRGRCSGRS